MLWLSCLLCFSPGAKAQEQAGGDYSHGYIPEMKLSLLALHGLLDPRPFLETSFERRMGAVTSAEAALGILLPRSFYDEDQVRLFDNTHSGIRLRLNIKRYVRQEDNPDNLNTYWSPELMFNYNTLRSTGWYERFDNVYQQYMTYTRRQIAVGWGLRWGQQWFPGNGKFLFVDYYLGLGIRTLIINTKDTPEDLVLFNDDASIGFNTRGPGRYWHPYFTCGFRVGLVLKR